MHALLDDSPAPPPACASPGPDLAAAVAPNPADRDWPAGLPSALVRPLEAVFSRHSGGPGESFLAGLRAAALLGAARLSASARRRAPLAWIGVALAAGPRRLFDDLRGGCWVRGFPAVGRGRAWLQRAGLGSAAELAATLRELGLPDTPGAALYFNFHYGDAAAGCERGYVLDADRRQLHGFATPAPAPAHLRACAAAF